MLPAIAADLRYDAQEGVQDGGMAMGPFLEAIADATNDERRLQIAQQLVR